MNTKEKNITLLIGLPGSGKSYWLKNNISLTKENAIFDDISQTDSKLIGLKEALNNQSIENIYISDVNFINKEVLLQAKKRISQLYNGQIIFKQIVFIGELEICKNNVQLRADGRNVNGTLQRFKDTIKSIADFLREDSNTKFIIVKDYSLKKDKISKP